MYSVRIIDFTLLIVGYKGMVGIDERLEGVKMRLRKSMNKFEGLGEGEAPIEIARWFDRPGTAYLNRCVQYSSSHEPP